MLRNRAARLAIAGIVVGIAAGGCSLNKETTVATATTVPVTLGSTTSTSTSKGSTTTAPTKLAKPEDAASHLFEAWKAGDRTAAKQFATFAAVDTIFSHPYTSPAPAFMGCDREADHYNCNYFYEGGGMHFLVDGGAAAGWIVSKVTYTAD
jgi:hypothetical protein